jgi:hypothetical protein
MFDRIATTCAVMLTSAAVGSVTIVAPAFAASRAHPPARSIESTAPGQGIQGTTVYSRGRYAGRDPDPSIRAQLLRDNFHDRSM